MLIECLYYFRNWNGYFRIITFFNLHGNFTASAFVPNLFGHRYAETLPGIISLFLMSNSGFAGHRGRTVKNLSKYCLWH
jgi:hypothetical protein